MIEEEDQGIEELARVSEKGGERERERCNGGWR
jgi:hypothetical protein